MQSTNAAKMPIPTLPNGIYPVLFTPLTQRLEVDWPAFDMLVDFYCAKGVHGIFTNCLTGECYDFSRDTLLKIARRTQQRASGRAVVVAGGNCSGGDLRTQAAELADTYAQGVAEAIVLVAALPQCIEGQTLGEQLVELARLCPGVPLGLYEVPSPKHVLLSLDDLRTVAGSGRYRFVKDTCRDNGVFEQRLQAVQGSPVKLFQANLGCCPRSLEMGAAGFSGYAANIAPELMLRLWHLTHGGESTRRERGMIHSAVIALQTQCTKDKHWPAAGKLCVATRPGGVEAMTDTVFAGNEPWHTRPITAEARQRVASFVKDFDFVGGTGSFAMSEWAKTTNSPNPSRM